jgi:hypothetical protein
MEPVYHYSKQIRQALLPGVCDGKSVLDLGCGSMSTYIDELRRVKSYVGVDLDLAQLHKADRRVQADMRFRFCLLDLACSWSPQRQNRRFQHDLWKTYYERMHLLSDKQGRTQRFDSILCLFSAHCANTDPATWQNFVRDVTAASWEGIPVRGTAPARPGTQLCIVFIDADRCAQAPPSPYFAIADGKLTVTLPHRPSHTEPALGHRQLEQSFTDRGLWQLHPAPLPVDARPIFDPTHPLASYMELISWVVFTRADRS